MDLTKIEEIKRIALIAMFSDDDLMNALVLKGGNALDLIYKVDSRSSLDLDFSIEGQHTAEELQRFEEKIIRALKSTFEERGFAAFDIQFTSRPDTISPDMAPFWGGYRVVFKILESSVFARLAGQLDQARKQAQVFTATQGKTFIIDISKLEYCQTKRYEDLDGFRIYVYTPEMIAIEKLRAICQQMAEYGTIVRNPSRAPRAQDFYDFHIVLEHFQIKLSTSDNLELAKCIFAAKRVPLSFVELIPNYREYHRSDFDKVITTVRPAVKLRDYDFYFDYMVRRALALKPLWVKEPPGL